MRGAPPLGALVAVALAAVALAAVAAPPSLAQADRCEPTATALLDNAGVRAELHNTGGLFWRGRGATYEVPKDGGLDAIFTANLWVAGQREGVGLYAMSTYGPWEFWPGPLDADGEPPADCAAYDRIWRVTLADVAAYNATGEATPDLAEWPAHAGAPVVDGDGDPDTYDLDAGDRPAILGDETAWWVMNDDGWRGPAFQTHGWSLSPEPVQIEVQATAFTISRDYAEGRLGLSRRDAGYLHHATAYRYRLTYRGDAPLENAYVGLFVDPDLGDFSDDYVGSHPQGDLAFAYNADNLDRRENVGYGESPPALGVRVIDGPADKPLGGMAYFTPFGSAFPESDGDEAYLYLQGFWADGTPLRRGNDGYNTDGERTTYAFSDLPPSYWSEPNLNGEGRSNTPGDRRMVLSHGPFSLQPGESAEVSFAIPWARSERGHYASVYELVTFASPLVGGIVRTIGPDPELATITPDRLPVAVDPVPPAPEAPARYALSAAARPSPAATVATVRFDLPEAATVRLAVSDALGREVAVPAAGPREAGEHTVALDVSGWAPGLYVYRLTVAGGPAGTGRLTVAR